MKKFYCLGLILLSMFSCFFFAACGDKYEDLKMVFYSAQGEEIEQVSFLIDENGNKRAERIGIEFLNIKSKDIGQVKIYSIPNELIVDTNYSYSDNMCYVDITPVIPSSENAKLVVSHLSSGKKKEIDLKIEQKSKDISITNSNYIVSIPEENSKLHIVDFSQLINLIPVGSTDKTYFKILQNVNNVPGIVVENEAIEETDLFCGFNVDSSLSDGSFVKICPVTVVEGYESSTLVKHENDIITIHFRKTLRSEDVEIVPKEEINVDLNNIQLVANDLKAESITLALKNEDVALIETNYMDMYEFDVVSTDDQKILCFIDGGHDVVIEAEAHTTSLVEVKIILKPINYVGELFQIQKSVFVKGELKADNIEVRKNNKIITTHDKTDIFDYYDEGNSLGALFNFKPYTFSGTEVNYNLRTMRVLVTPDIISSENVPEKNNFDKNGDLVAIGTKLYALMFHLYNEPLEFTYNVNTGLMESAEITENSRVYIKYVDGNPAGMESSNFGIQVTTINKSSLENWENLELAPTTVNFNRVEGVKSMSIEAGYYIIDGVVGSYSPLGTNPEYIYLNRLEGLDNVDAAVKYVAVKNLSVLSVDGMPIQNVDFDVEIESINEVDNALSICEGAPTRDAVAIQDGNSKIRYHYDSLGDEDVVGLVFRRNTSIGDYVISFYQGDVVKGSVIVRVYENLEGIKTEYIDIETNKKAFKNTDYLDVYDEANYIVASHQDLDIAINLPQSVLDSNIVAGYKIEFVIGYFDGPDFIEKGNKGDYFEIVHDDSLINNAVLKFVEGTYLEDRPQYVYLTLTVQTKKFDDIITEAIDIDESNVFSICFFVYDEIKNEDITINHKSMTRYFEEYLGVYYQEKSHAELEVLMSGDLWNYVTPLVGGNKVDWKIDDASGVTFNPNETICSLNFKRILGQDEYLRVVKAYVYQFDNVYELQCVFSVEKPIISEKVIIKSNVNVSDGDEDYYINLKKGESYTIDARNYSSKGDVTHAEIIIQVADETGSAFSAKEYFDVNQTTGTITVKKVDDIHQFKLIVFAKDALKYIPSADKSGYSYPSGFMMDLENEDKGLYLNAFFVLNIELSDGTEGNPYLIKNANDFWQIDDSEEFREAYYKLMKSLSLNNTTDANAKTIVNFKGTILTNNNNVYTLDGITLDNVNKNLFKNFAGSISNIKFVVGYDYNYNASVMADEHLGLFDINNGVLVDVSATVNGVAKLNANSTNYYFGGLVGLNIGQIEYKKAFGVNGTIALQGESKVFFGGIAGENIGNIVGLEVSPEHVEEANEIKLNVATGREKTMSQIVIQSQLGANSAIGGVVGLNTFDVGRDVIGIVRNGFVDVIINAENTSNVGGVIGINRQQSNNVTFTKSGEYISAVSNLLHNDYISKAIYNMKSASTINAQNNVGGIVGLDENGLFIECDFQVLSDSIKKVTIKGNENVGGIAGQSTNGKFAYCSVMSYWWNYASLQSDLSDVIVDCEDILAQDYVGGIVGLAVSSADMLSSDPSFDVNNRVLVLYSSVNAYLSAKKEVEGGKVGNIGGILSTAKNRNYKSIIFNAYFVGMLDGCVDYSTVITTNGGDTKTHYLCLDNNSSSIYNAAYTLNLQQVANETRAYLGHIKNGLLFNIENEPGLNYWWWNANINGGYIFITNKIGGKYPIFDLSPDSINVTVKNPKVATLDKVLVLDYYDFSSNTSLNDSQISDLNEATNRNQKVLDLLSFETSPSGLGTVVLNVKSTNRNIVDVTIDGRLLINGVGECELIFSSVLNPNAGDIVDRTIKIVVDYPIGDEFYISTSKTDLSQIVTTTQNIIKNSSRQYYIITKGILLADLNVDTEMEEYSYKTKDNVCLKISIKYQTTDAEFMVGDYVGISGQEGIETHDATYKILTINLDNKTPLTISVLKQIENLLSQNYAFTLEFEPYTVIETEKVFYLGKNATFNLSTLAGATEVSFSYDEAIVYPNDTVYLTGYIKTDIKYDNINDILKFIKIRINSSYKCELDEPNNRCVIKQVSDDKIVGEIFVDDCSRFENNIQTIVFRIEFGDIIIAYETNMLFEYEISNGYVAEVNYTIIPQRINKLEIKNFYYKNVGTEYVPDIKLVLDDILKPDYPGYMVVDIVPDKGYYSYIEVSDITGDEEILFIEVDEDGNALTLQSDPSSDNKGIKIYNPNLNKKRIYIKTQIDRNYSSKLHTIEIRAYSNNGSLLYRQTKEIDVKMLPSITVNYLLPNGEIGETIESTNADRPKVLLANGVDAKFMILTENANSELEYQITAYNQSGDEDASLLSKYNFALDVGNHYVLDRQSGTPDESDIGKKIRITFTIFSYFDNGDFDKAECYIEFEIVAFVIHGISVNNSIDNIDKHEIYGYFDKPVKLNFYFDEYDISFYDKETENEPFWNTVYKYTQRKENEYVEGESLYQIYSILKEINGYDNTYQVKENNEYLILNDGQKDVSNRYTYAGTPQNIELRESALTVIYKEDEDYSPKYLAVAFKMSYDSINNKWNVNNYTTDVGSGIIQYVVDKNYDLNFIHATNWYEPTVIHNEEDFLEMTSGGRYILAKDLTFKTYTPLDVNVLEFDGNGRTITIQGFDKFNEEEIHAGLFKQVYENMIVKNVVVNYESIEVENSFDEYTFGSVTNNAIEYADLCNNSTVNYTKLDFGGVAAVNAGIITNCSVTGLIAVRASTIEQKKFVNESGYAINFFIGGMVAENLETGYITNSTSHLNIFAQANIGGFVYSNVGKISSCAVEQDVTIYGYNTSLEKTIVIETAGFVVENFNEISMSYVNLMKSADKLNLVNKGTMSSKDISAGFVYQNTGKIYDAYVQMTETGINNNSFSGFVNLNNGSIYRAYTYVNGGSKVDNNDSMFAPAGTENLSQCIEIVVNKSGYSSGINEGLKTVFASERFDKTQYESQGFVFGDNTSAIWSVLSGNLPTIVSTMEKVEFEGEDDYDGLMPLYKERVESEDGVDKHVYKPHFAYYGTKENPYIITDLASWNEYFVKDPNAYFRIVKDIDFLSHGNNPTTSTITFRGNIQGNNMILSNIMLYSTSSLDALGLFKNMESLNDETKENAVRNLTLTTTSVWASKTSAVGLLAGVIEDFNIYNISIDAPNVIMVGGNAVGGIAGVVRGEFDIDNVYSNIGANSTRASTLYNYSIYMSKNNKKNPSANLQNVYYAGSIVGILDGYHGSYDINDDNNTRDISKKYYFVRNAVVNDNVTIIGDTVGAAFGFVGERVYVNNCDVNISGSIFGAQYSAGVVGENRGVLMNVKATLADDLFDNSSTISSGLVGLNIGGLVMNAEVNAKIYKTGYGKIVGGIIGRNIYGTISNAKFSGELRAFFTGGFVGTNYTNKMLVDTSTGQGALSAECKTNNANLIPKARIKYFNNAEEIVNYENLTLSEETFEYMLNLSKEFYTYKNDEGGNTSLAKITIKNQVLGLVVGLSFEKCGTVTMAFDVDKNLIINSTEADVVDKIKSGKLQESEGVGVILRQGIIEGDSVRFVFDNVRTVYYETDISTVIYLTGAIVTSFDSWANNYSDDYIVFTKLAVVTLPTS